MTHSLLNPVRALASMAVAGVALAAPSHASSPAELLAAYSKEAGVAPSPERGQRLFNTDFGTELRLRCASCHGAVPTQAGKDDLTGKTIRPLAPAFNPASFTDRARADHLFRLNCKDFVGRECTPGEKADVLSWLLTLR